MDEVVPRPRMRGAHRRTLVTKAALRVFAEKGYHAATLHEIATAAGVTRTVLYDHFPSKRVLLLAVMQERNTALIEHVGARITATGSPRDRMRSTINAYFSFAKDQPDARALLFDRAEEDDPEIRTVRRGIRDARTRAITTLLAGDIRSVGVDPAEPVAEAMVELLITGLDGVAQWWQRHPDVPRDTLVEGAMRMLWIGLGNSDA